MNNLSQRYIIKRILQSVKQYRILIILSILFAILVVIGNLLTPILFGLAIDNIIEEGQVYFDIIARYLIQIIFTVTLTAVFQWLMSVINNKITYSVVRDLRFEAFSKIQKLPLSFIDKQRYGDIVSRNISDIDQFADGLLMGFSQLFTGILTIIGTLILMVTINWIIALVVVILTPASLFVAKFIASRTYSMFKLTSEVRGEQTAFIDEMIGNLKIVKAYGREDKNNQTFDEVNDRLTKASLNSIFFSSLTNPCTRFINSLVYAAVAFTGALTLINPTLLPIAFSVGKLSTLLSYANQYTKPFNEISGVITELQNAIACAGRVYQFIDEAELNNESALPAKFEGVKGEVSFNKIYFSYDSNKKLIENISFRAYSGQHVAIVGPTGCGKTTLINLLMRFYELNDGVISVDGVDVTKISCQALRKNYGMVLQDTWLKSGTVWDNIVIGKPNATKEEVITAAKATFAHHFIEQLPNGYDTYLSEDGDNLSQGQKQLLCITRIMLALPPMLILDEATSSIDTRTEQKIQKAFNEMMNGRTTFIVAHRLSTIKEADVILVMKDGNIIEQGNHNQLLKNNGFYHELYNSQFAK